MLLDVKRKKDEKKKVLEEQLKIIAAEKVEVDSDVEKMKHQVEVRNITKKISELNNKTTIRATQEFLHGLHSQREY